jgi:tetratricopeptide (TPR) repeat protein
VRAFAVFALWVVLVSLGHGVAFADDKSEAAALYTEGRALYDAGQFEKAAVKFKAAHARHPDPVYLFNAGQALRFAKQCDEAVELYEKFLAAVPAAPNREAVEGYLVEVRTCSRPKPPDRPTPPPPPPPSSSGTRTLGIVVGALGLVSLGVGGYYSSKVVAYNDEAAAYCKGATEMMPCMSSEAAAARVERINDVLGPRAQLKEIIAYSVGGAAVVAGVLLILKKPSRARESRMSVVPTAGGVMATTAWRF